MATDLRQSAAAPGHRGRGGGRWGEGLSQSLSGNCSGYLHLEGRQAGIDPGAQEESEGLKPLEKRQKIAS